MARRLLPLVLALVASSFVLAPAAAGGSCHVDPDVGMKSSTDDRVRIARCAFTDTVTYVEPGATVTWENRDVFPHTVTGAAGSWGDLDALNRGDSVAYTFEDEGVFPYYCELHPSMVGAVVVGDAAPPADDAAPSIEKAEAAAPIAADDRDSGGSGPAAAVTGAGLAAALAAAVVTLRMLAKRRTSATTA